MNEMDNIEGCYDYDPMNEVIEGQDIDEISESLVGYSVLPPSISLSDDFEEEYPPDSSGSDLSKDPAVKKYLLNLIYPKIIFDKDCMTSQTHHTMKSKEKLDERGKLMFQYINKIVTHVTATGIKLSSLKTYETHMIRYVLYVSQHKTVEVENFSIQGPWMLECMQHVINKKSNVLFASIPQFNYALQKLQGLIAKYKTLSITDPNKKASEELILRRIENIHVLDEYYKSQKSHAHNTLLKLYLDKGRYKIYQPKYTIVDAKNMMIAMLKKSGSTKKSERQNAICALVAFLIGHHMLLRGDNKCKIEISDAVYNDEETFNGDIPILGFHYITGKTMNENSEPGLLGVCRNKDVEICLVSAFALSLWYRFDFGHMNAPLYHRGPNALDFLNKESWYDPKVIFNSDEVQNTDNVPVSSRHMQRLAALCFNSIDFVSAHNQHAGRQVNSERADAFGVDESQIRRAGRWKLDVLQQRYISSFAYSFIHYSAGFRPEEPYFIPRDIEVPESLQKQIFPWLEKTIELVANRTDHKKGKYQNDTAIPRFLQMLLKFRSIILQDLALLLELVPESVYSKHPITSDPEFIQFREAVRHATENSTIFNSSPEVKEAFDRACPVIAKEISVIKVGIEKINLNDQNILSQIGKGFEQTLASLENGFKETLASLENGFKETLLSLQNGQSAMFQFFQTFAYEFFNLNQKVAILQNKLDASQDSCKNLLNMMLSMQHQPLLPMNDDDLNTTCTPELATSTSVQTLNEDGRSIKKRKRAPDTKLLNDPSFETSEFDISNPTTVQDLMCEFYFSLPGKLSIAQRDEKYEGRWRRVFPGRKTRYKKMKAVINVINEIHKDTNLPTYEVAISLDRYRLEKGWNMNKLMNNMRNQDSAESAIKALIKSTSETQDQ